MRPARTRWIALSAAVAGLIGLGTLFFGVANSTHHAQATTPDGAWKLIGQIAIVKKGPGVCAGKDCHDVIHATVPASAKAASLVDDQHVIIVSDPPDPVQDYPHSWKVVSYKAPELYLERIEDTHCTKPAAPSGAPSPGTIDLYAGPCNKPGVGGGNEADLSGVSDITVDFGNPDADLIHCIARTDINSGEVKLSAVCFDGTGLLGPGAAAEPIMSKPGEGPVGDGNAVGPPPPPPYAAAPPVKGVGTYAGDNLHLVTCFPDAGNLVNIIAILDVTGAHAQLAGTGKLVGTVDVRLYQTNANCNALTPTGSPAVIGTTIYPATDIAACPAGDCAQSPYRQNGNVVHGYPDWDQDGCTDSDELWEPKPDNSTKCGDDPWNPFDYVSGTDVSGTYDVTVIAARQDLGVPGSYYYCETDIDQSGKNLTTRLLCYLDSPALTVNPQAAVPAGAKTCPPAAAQYCGDGMSGAPPPGTTAGTYPTNARLLADVDDVHTVLTGVLDNVQNVIKLHGCFEDRDNAGSLGDVYMDAIINAHTGHGMVNLWTELSNGLTNVQCLAGTPPGTGSLMPVDAVRQALKGTPPAGRDSDSDGCPNRAELGDTQATGGLRDPSNHYDYFNPTGDGLNRVDDILAVVNQYFLDDAPGAPDMRSQTDRTNLAGGNVWNLGPPNGQQRVDDILASVKQYFQDCGGGNPPAQDSDGDGLPNTWETNGIDANGDTTADLILPGANPNHKDLYIEADWMADIGHDHNPDDSAINDVINAFANVPNTLANNPDHVDGISLHVLQDELVDVGGVNHVNLIIFLGRGPGAADDFDDFKEADFGTAAERADANAVNILAAKRLAYRYTIFGHNYSEFPGSSGIAELPGNDFLVSLGSFTNSVGTRGEQAGTFMHELGHTLGLHHGGADDFNCKPNYLSVMTYARQFSYLVPGRPLDYSRSSLPTLNEASLSEPAGIGGPAGSQTVFGPSPPVLAAGDQPVNWNRDGDSTDVGVAANINNIPEASCDGGGAVLTGHSDWPSLQFDFRSSLDFADGSRATVPVEPDLTANDVAVMKAIAAKLH